MTTTLHLAVVHPYAVHSRAVGGTTRVLALVRHMVGRGHRVTVLAHADEADPAMDAAAVCEMAAVGVTQRFFRRPAPTPARKLVWAAGRVPYHVSRNRNPALEHALGELVNTDEVDAVHLEFGYLAALLPASDRAVCGLAEQEVMSLARARLRQVPLGERTWYERAAVHTTWRVRAFEQRMLRRFDVLFGITADEAQVLAGLAGREVGVLPHVVDIGRFVPCAARRRDQLLFVGNFTHAPNVYAVSWFLQTVWPTVRAARPGTSWVIVGPGIDAGLRARLEAAGAEVRGFVQDLPAVYGECAVFVNPVRTGGGMRGKVLEAMASGAPVISTTVGLDGVAGVPGRHYRVADASTDWARAIESLLGDDGARLAMGAAGRQWVAQHFEVTRVCAQLEAAYVEAVARRGGGVRRRTA